ncbi:MAG: peptide chain release factor N(5)-glutamine methyltransferase [Sodaliphilus sp.]
MTTDQILREFKRQIAACYERGEADAIALIVMEEVLHYSRVDVLLRGDVEQDEVFADRIFGIAQRLCEGEPIQYILGHTTFHGHIFRLTPATLIPRPETECLVDMIVDEAGDEPDLQVLDIGTGSGCIAISIALALKWPEVTGIDISEAALEVARKNAEQLGARVDFCHADILSLAPNDERYHIIVSNPPYVCQSESAEMERHVLDHEPASALFVPDSNPLLFYRAIAAYAQTALHPGGRIYFEINRRFGSEICHLLAASEFESTQVINDPFGNPRYVKATKK